MFAARLPSNFRIEDVTVRPDRSQRGLMEERQFAFVDLSDQEAVHWCLSNGPWILNGMELQVDEKKANPRRASDRPMDGKFDASFFPFFFFH